MKTLSVDYDDCFVRLRLSLLLVKKKGPNGNSTIRPPTVTVHTYICHPPRQLPATYVSIYAFALPEPLLELLLEALEAAAVSIGAL